MDCQIPDKFVKELKESVQTLELIRKEINKIQEQKIYSFNELR